ncbi:MAG: Uma2 family endonuclease [Planctomycetes bacterium]|nr:Uma2 family endonuclease [Planctomycetota bacterium]
MAPWEFDRAQFERGFRYELINGVLIVSPAPLENQRDPNDELGRLLRNYQENHPDGSALDATLPEHTIRTAANRRVADRAIWTGLGRLPLRSDIPAIVVEFVSAGKRNVERDYESKRDEYLGGGVLEYWIFDRFARVLTVFQRKGDRFRRPRVFNEDQTLTTGLLPGFELPLKKLFALADRWQEEV